MDKCFTFPALAYFIQDQHTLPKGIGLQHHLNFTFIASRSHEKPAEAWNFCKRTSPRSVLKSPVSVCGASSGQLGSSVRPLSLSPELLRISPAGFILPALPFTAQCFWLLEGGRRRAMRSHVHFHCTWSRSEALEGTMKSITREIHWFLVLHMKLTWSLIILCRSLYIPDIKKLLAIKINIYIYIHVHRNTYIYTYRKCKRDRYRYRYRYIFCPLR